MVGNEELRGEQPEEIQAAPTLAYHAHLIENASDAIIASDARFVTTAWNRAAEKMYGWSAEEVMGKPTIEILQPEFVDVDRDEVFRRLLEEGHFEGQVIHLRKDGTRIHTEARAVALRDEDGRITGFVSIDRDITERVHAEVALREARTAELSSALEELQVTQRQVIQSSKLAAIGELAAGVAHEINNPLSSVIGFTELLIEQDLPDEALRDLKTIHAEGKRAARIVESLLVFARNNETKREAVDLRTVIERACGLMALDVKRSTIDLRTEVPRSLPPVWGDEQRLVQVLLNLLSNAQQPIAATGRPGVVTVNCSVSDDRVQVRVSDDGPGIPSEVLERIFEPFFTTKEVGEGTGLGLSVCQGIVRQHNGELWAESSAGEGATFYIVLPVGVGAPS